MNRKNFIPPICFLLLVLLAEAAIHQKAEAALVGGWKPIKDLKDPHVKEVGQFAVTEHNKEAKTDLKLQKILSGQTQVVSGINYKLVLVVVDGAGKDKYEAVVWEKPWAKFMNLTSFMPIN